MSGADVVGPEIAVAVTVTSYVFPGARPARLQSYGSEHTTVMGAPPPIGVAATVYGPLVPLTGDTSTIIEPGPVTVTAKDGAVTPGVVSGCGGEGPVELFDEMSTPRAVTA